MEEKIDRLSSMMIEAVRDESPQDGVSLLMSAVMNVVKHMGTVLGYPPLELEYIILTQLCSQFGLKASRAKRNK